MFQNDKIAQQHADRIYAAQRRAGVSVEEANRVARQEQQRAQAELDQQTRNNVGLN